MAMSPLSAADDSFHPPADADPLWTETTWWGFRAADRPLGGMVYTLFRPHLNVASLIVQVWDDEAVEPWLAPYARTLWHIPYPETDLTACEVGGLSLRCIEPLGAYRLSYEDLDLLSFDLVYRAMASPYEVPIGGGSGHFDQVCRVTGTVRLGADEIGIDGPAVRDRSWYVRRDQRTLRAAYTYGVVDDSEHFVAHGRAAPGAGDESVIVGGYLERGGLRSALANGTRRVASRRRGHPDVIEVTATDAAGRELSATGRVVASLASQSTPGMFAWMSMADWEIGGRQGTGEDHDVWSPDQLAATRAARLGPTPH